jgi:hypothetical protein
MFISFHPTAKTAPQTAKGWRVCQVISMAHLSEIVVGKVWSNCVWNYCRRISTEFKESYFLALDFDSPETTLLQAIKEWSDTRHVIGTTKNHGKEKHGIVCDRFRIIAPWSETIFSLNSFKQNQKRFIKLYDSDPACSGAAQLYFPCRDIVSVNEEGYSANVEPEKIWAQKIKNHKPISVSPSVRYTLQSEVVPAGTRNNKFFSVALHLFDCGMEEERIIGLILDSPTYRGQPVEKEIAATVKSAAKTYKNKRTDIE